MFYGKETGNKIQFACLIFHWITHNFWCANSVGNAYCFLSLKFGKKILVEWFIFLVE